MSLPSRAKQVWSQLWKRTAMYDQMIDIPPMLRERLAAELPLGIEVLDERTVDRGSTRKALLRLGGEHVIEDGPDGLSGSGRGVRLFAGRLRDGVRLLRDRPDGARVESHGG